MTRTKRSLWAACALAAATTGLAAAGDGETTTVRRIEVVHLDGHAAEEPHVVALDEATDRLEITDLDSLAEGETRTYWSEGGRQVDVTHRGEAGYLVEAEGKQVALPNDLEIEALVGAGGAGEGRRVVRIEHRKDGEDGEVGDDAEASREEVDRIVLRHVPGEMSGPTLAIEIRQEGEEVDGTVAVQKRVIVIGLQDEP